MGAHDSPRFRAITRAQLIAVLVLLLAALYLASFAAKSYELYQLRTWKASLQEEIAALDRQEKTLKLEVQRRHSVAWVDQALRETGRVPNGVIVVSTLAGETTAIAAPLPAPTAVAKENPAQPAQDAWFSNANWDAWQQLILQRD